MLSVFSLAEFLPAPSFLSAAAQVVGSIVIFVGLLLLLLAGNLFKRADTDMIPFKNVSALVTTGIYRYTRNPMYLGMAAILLGCGLTVGAASSLLVAPVFMVIIQMRFIRPEEAMLLDLFPEQFAQYRTEVRRWL
ncbi:MAG: protein-S-isoprenylcysteine O-methyltransferase Ste14 [Halioglobus sp.]